MPLKNNQEKKTPKYIDQNEQMNDLKSIDLVVLLTRIVWPKFQLKRRIVEASLFNDPLVTFLISVCPKIYTFETNKKYKIEAWKPIGLVV